MARMKESVNDRKPVATTLGLALLALVDKTPQSGYDLCQIFETTPMSHYSSSPGAIYPALKRLEREGLARGRNERMGSLRPRRVYRSTEAGHRALVGWVSQPLDQSDVLWRLDEVMLRFAFMGGLVDDSTTLRFLDSLATLLELRIAGLEEFLATMPAEPPHGRLGLTSGIAQFRGLVRWAHEAIELFNDRLERER